MPKENSRTSPNQLAVEIEHEWLSQLEKEVPYGFYRDETDKLWLLLQPQVFYQQRSRLMDGQLILGRVSGSTELSILTLDLPDVDKHGVSRMHAALIPMERSVGLHDVGSTNGTYHNGQRLVPGLIYHLKAGDHIRLSSLDVYVHFVPLSHYQEAMRANLRRYFSPEVQQILDSISVGVEALHALLRRVPDDAYLHYRVLASFLADYENDPQFEVGVEEMHQRINFMIGPSPDHTTTHLTDSRLANLDDDDYTNHERPSELDSVLAQMAQERERQRERDKPTEEYPAALDMAEVLEPQYSEAYLNLQTELRADLRALQKALYDHLLVAGGLTQEFERQDSLEQISLMLKQLNIWLSLSESDNNNLVDTRIR